MKLYEVPRDTNILFEGQEFMFFHVDGAYSYCKDKDGNIVHISANADVEITK